MEQQNVVIFLPLHKYEKIENGNIVIKEEPLFSGYIFAQIDTENVNWTSVRSTRGVSNIVKFGNDPAVVDQVTIDNLKKIDSLSPEPYIKHGDLVRVTSGSFRGIDAIYQASDGESRSYILLEFMHQNQRLSLDNAKLMKI